jgi:hypothetical protein
MPELDADQLNDLKEGGSYAIFEANTGEQVTEWAYPDENGEITFDFSRTVTEFEIGLKLEDGTILLGEHTTIEAVEEI